MSDDFRAGFVGLVGPSNSGKSTLLNQIIGQKISIVSSRPQTTLRSIRGILNRPTGQMIFVDTPGIQLHPKVMGAALNELADRQAQGCDVLLWVFDASAPSVMRQIQSFSKNAAKLKKPELSVCALNKVDKIDKPSLLPMIAAIAETQAFSEIVPISALKNDGVNHLESVLFSKLSNGAPLYPTDSVTDRNEAFLISEIIREKFYHVTRQELPYSLWIEVEKQPDSGKMPHYLARIHADSDSRKAILIGKKGHVLKEVGTRSRKEVERLLKTQVCLKLHVDVHKEWRFDKGHVRRYLEMDG